MTKRRVGKAAVFLLMVITMLMVSTGAWALSYYSGDESSNTTIKLSTATDGTRTLQFYSTIGTNITGPATDAVISNAYQFISGTYTMTQVGSGVYSLSGGSTNISVNADEFAAGASYMTALARALTINFNTNTITWGDVTNVNVTTAGEASAILQDFMTDNVFAFASFTFEENTNESAWLAGTRTSISLRYQSELAGAPEPAEWALMLLGLFLMGYYLHRKGLLNLQFSPQTYA